MNPNTPYRQWQRWSGIMKCYPFEEKRLAKWAPPYLVQPKLDGIRCRAVPTPSGFMLLSSEENAIFSAPHIEAALNRCEHLKGIELDGELYSHSIYIREGFEGITTITSRTKNLHPDYEQMRFHIFDIVNDKPQAARAIQLNHLFDAGCPNYCIKVPYKICENLDDIMRYYDELMCGGYEGIIVRHLDAPYVKKRSIYVMKFKPKQEDSYTIVGVQEEVSKDGVPKNALGALICKGGDNVEFRVGSGYTRHMRESLWKMSDRLIGKKLRVRYQHITSGRGVPRFPVAVSVID